MSSREPLLIGILAKVAAALLLAVTTCLLAARLLHDRLQPT
jgi:hypothetical protein